MKRFENKLIEKFFGIQEPIDEHALAVLGRAAIHAVIGILIFELIFTIAVCMIPFPDFEDAYYIMTLVQLVSIVSIIIGTTSVTINKQGLNHLEVTPSAYPRARKRVRLKAIVTGLITTSSFHVLEALFSLRERPVKVSLTDPHQLLQTIVFGLVFTSIIYVISMKKLKIIQD